MSADNKDAVQTVQNCEWFILLYISSGCIPFSVLYGYERFKNKPNVLWNFLVTVKAAPHKYEIRTGLP